MGSCMSDDSRSCSQTSTVGMAGRGALLPSRRPETPGVEKRSARLLLGYPSWGADLWASDGWWTSKSRHRVSCSQHGPWIALVLGMWLLFYKFVLYFHQFPIFQSLWYPLGSFWYLVNIRTCKILCIVLSLILRNVRKNCWWNFPSYKTSKN